MIKRDFKFSKIITCTTSLCQFLFSHLHQKLDEFIVFRFSVSDFLQGLYQALKLIRTTIEYLKILLLLLHLKNPTQIKSIVRMLGESINFPQENMLEIIRNLMQVKPPGEFQC